MRCKQGWPHAQAGTDGGQSHFNEKKGNEEKQRQVTFSKSKESITASKARFGPARMLPPIRLPLARPSTHLHAAMHDKATAVTIGSAHDSRMQSLGPRPDYRHIQE